MDEPVKREVGRPTDYYPEICAELIKYFDIEPHFETPVVRTDKKGNITEKIVFIPSDLPTLAGFAKSKHIHRDTINQWSKDHPEFSDAIKYAKECQEHILVTNTLHNEYNPAFAIFFAKNNMNWTDKQDMTSGGEKLDLLHIYRPEKDQEGR